MPDQDWAGAPGEPRPALPDGSMPTYGSYPLPGTPGGASARAAFGWGPEIGGDDEYPLGQTTVPRKGRIGLVVSLLVICSVMVVGLVVLVASRGDDSTNSAPVAAFGRSAS